MRQVSGGFKNKLASGNSSLIRLWKIEVACKGNYYFTDNTRDVFYNGVLWKSKPGITISAIRQSSLDGYDDAEVSFPISDDGINESVVRYNELNGARFTIVAVHFEALEHGEMFCFGGKLSDATIEGNKATIRALGSSKDNTALVIGELYSERCRNVIYDNRCKVNKAKYRLMFTVIGVTPEGDFYISIKIPEPEQEAPGENTESKLLTKETIIVPNYPSEEANSGAVAPMPPQVNGKHKLMPETVSVAIQLAGGGGAAAALYVSPNSFRQERLGFAGQTSVILNLAPVFYAEGGLAGRFDRPDGPDVSGAYNANTSNSDGPYGGGWGLRSPNYEPQKPQTITPYPFIPFGVTIYKGARGAVGSKIYSVGEGRDLPSEYEFEYLLGNGGHVHHPEIPTGYFLNGQHGYIRIVETYIGELKTIVDAGPQQEFDYGSIEWISGGNACRTTLVSSISDGKISVLVNTARPIKVGDVGYYLPGCTNYRSYCIKKFNNFKNFRAEPDVPNITNELTLGVEDDAPPLNN